MRIGVKHRYMVREIGGRILSAIEIEEIKSSKGTFAAGEPQIFLAANETYSNDAVKWVKFDGTKEGPKRTVKGISVGQLVSPVYHLLSQYQWPTELKKKFLMYGSAATALLKDYEICYYEDLTESLELPDTIQSKGIADATYAEQFEPIREALMEVAVYDRIAV